MLFMIAFIQYFYCTEHKAGRFWTQNSPNAF